MLELLESLLTPGRFIPHGHCYLWQPDLVWLHIISDLAIALAYYAIPLLLLYFTRQRQDLPFKGIFLLFGAFIISCGTTHLLEIWTLWYPVYWLSGFIKAVTAVVSLFTVLELVTLIPKALTLPSPAQLSASNQELANQIAERKRTEKALRESESTLRSFYNSINLMMGIVEIYKEDVLHISGNAAVAKFTQRNQESLQNQWASQMGTSLQQRQMWIRHYLKSQATKAPVRFEYTFDRNDELEHFSATVCPISQVLSDETVAQPRYAYVIEDITARKQIEEEVRRYNAELQRALDFEERLKRITDRVRDSLDENQILQTAVKELGLGLQVQCCSAASYDLTAGISTISHEYSTSDSSVKSRVVKISDLPEVYNQLLQGECCQFCSIQPSSVLEKTSILTCPVVDNRETLGDLWLINDKDHIYSDLELRLVQQVANQCAIALRQCRLYQAAQIQVKELEQLNQLKDDFLSTVSHELRTPMTTIQLATQMLEIRLAQHGVLQTDTKGVAKYVQILQDECRREITLINDLLDLSRLDAQTEPLILSSIDPYTLIPHIAGSFADRMRNQQQRLELHVDKGLPWLTTNVSYLERILIELLNNACKYTPPGETITITASVEDDLSVLTPELAGCSQSYTEPANSTSNSMNYSGAVCSVVAPLSPAWLQISISNSGIEIPESERDRIFEKFYRIPHSDPWKHGGTGLGLALVKKLSERLGCTIHIESARKQTTFIVRFFIPDRYRSRVDQP